MQHKFQVGDKVRFEPQEPCPRKFSFYKPGTCNMGCISGVVCHVYDNGKVLFDSPTSGKQESASPDCCLPCLHLVEFFEQNQPQEVVMNEVIAGLYEKTADAVVVNKWFGALFSIPDSPVRRFDVLILTLNHKSFLAEAQRLEAEEKAKAEK